MCHVNCDPIDHSSDAFKVHASATSTVECAVSTLRHAMGTRHGGAPAAGARGVSTLGPLRLSAVSAAHSVRGRRGGETSFSPYCLRTY